MADIKSRLLLDNSNFNKNAKESNRLSKSLKAGLGAVGSAAKIAAVGLTAASASLAFFVTRSVQAIDRLGKVSKTTGFAAETLQKFQFAAEQSGVTADNAALALRRFSRRLGEAQRSTGELFPALKKLGIETRNSNGQFKSAEEILFEFADGITTARNESEQLSLAFKAFDSEGAELVETLKDGSAGLREFFKEAEDLGFILTASSIRGVEDFADEFNRLQNIVQGLINQFTAALAPALEGATRQFRDFIQLKIGEAGGLEEFGAFLKDQFLIILIRVTNALETFVNFMIDLANAIVKLARAAGSTLGIEVFPLTDAEIEKINKYKTALDGLTHSFVGRGPSNPPYMKMFIEMRDNLVELGLDLEDIDAAALAIVKRIEEGGKASFFKDKLTNNFKDEFEKIKEQLKTVISDGGDMFGQVDFAPFTKMLIGNLEENKEAAKKVVDAIEEVVVTGQNRVGETLIGKIFGVGPVMDFWDNWYAAGESALEKFKAIAGLILGPELIDKIKEGFANSDIGDFTKTLADGLVKGVEMFEDSLADAIVQGKADFSALGDHLKQALAKAMVQKFITGPIMGLFGLASGGPAKSGQPYIVGEEGPELFIPKNSGTVIPNDETMGIMGAGGPAMGMGRTNVTYNIQAVDAPSFQQLVARDPEFIFNVSRAGSRRTPA